MITSKKCREIFIQYAHEHNLPYPMTVEDEINAIVSWVDKQYKELDERVSALEAKDV